MNYFIVIDSAMGVSTSFELYSRIRPFGANLTEAVTRVYVYGVADRVRLGLILNEIKRAGFVPVLERGQL